MHGLRAVKVMVRVVVDEHHLLLVRMRVRMLMMVLMLVRMLLVVLKVLVVVRRWWRLQRRRLAQALCEAHLVVEQVYRRPRAGLVVEGVACDDGPRVLLAGCQAALFAPSRGASPARGGAQGAGTHGHWVTVLILARRLLCISSWHFLGLHFGCTNL